MIECNYDEQTDSIYAHLRRVKAYETIEVNSNILVDISQRNNNIVGVEIMQASKFISEIFRKKISRNTIKEKLKIHLKEETDNELRMDIEIGNQKIVYAIPRAYSSPLVATC